MSRKGGRFRKLARTSNTARLMSVPRRHAENGVDPVEVAAAETTVYPDEVQFLDAPAGEDGVSKIPHGVTKWVLRGEAQFRQFGHEARDAIRDLSATAFSLTDSAEDQTRRRDGLRAVWERARARAEHLDDVLGPYQQHHGVGETVRYVITWLLLIVGDTASGTLVLVFAGEEPSYAALMMVALGAAAVTTGLLAKDLKRRHLWLSVQEQLSEDPAEASVVRKAFGAGEQAWRFGQRVVTVGATAVLLAAVGTFTFRTAVDNPVAGFAYAMWAISIGAASWWSAWTHTDPAHTAIQNAQHCADRARKAYVAAPVDAIGQRAGNLAAIAEILADYENQAWAAWYSMLAAAAEYLRNNPALAGQGTDGLSYLHAYRPATTALFDRLADEFHMGADMSYVPGSGLLGGRASEPGKNVVELNDRHRHQRPTPSEPVPAHDIDEGEFTDGATGS